jgi:hypothetical protein
VHERDPVLELTDELQEIVEHGAAVPRLAERGRGEHHRDRLPSADDLRQRLLMQRARRIAGADGIDAHRVGHRR